MGSETFYIAALGVLILATLTDVLDGYLARKLDSVSDFGNLFDVMADRILAVISITMLMVVDIANSYLALAVICREIAADSIRSFAARSNFVLPHNIFGRVKLTAIVLATASGMLGLAGTISSSAGQQVTNVLLAIALLSGVLSILVMRQALRSRHEASGEDES